MHAVLQVFPSSVEGLIAMLVTQVYNQSGSIIPFTIIGGAVVRGEGRALHDLRPELRLRKSRDSELYFSKDPGLCLHSDLYTGDRTFPASLRVWEQYQPAYQ